MEEHRLNITKALISRGHAKFHADRIVQGIPTELLTKIVDSDIRVIEKNVREYLAEQKTTIEDDFE